MQVIWTEPALDEIDQAYTYFADFNPQAAMNVAIALRAAGDSLEDFPQRGRPVTGTDMRELVAPYRFILRYLVTDDAVVILRVRHSSRRPTVS